jgi:hypothetical protein
MDVLGLELAGQVSKLWPRRSGVEGSTGIGGVVDGRMVKNQVK